MRKNRFRWGERPYLVGPLAALIALFGAAACGGDDGEPSQAPIGESQNVLDGSTGEEKVAATLKVGAAADLRNVMTDIQEALEAACSTKITYVFGSSGQLKTQIEAGADFGLYLSADLAFPQELASKGLVAPNALASYGVGRVVLATRAGLPKVTTLDQLSRADIERIAIANPEHAPYGRAAKQALERAGVYTAVKEKLVLGENIRQTTDYVEKGDAEAGIVALALVIKGSPANWELVDSSLHEPIRQGGAVIRGTGAEKTARCVLQYLLDDDGQSALRAYGFEPASP